MGRIIPYIMGNKKCLKPPTSHHEFMHIFTIPQLTGSNRLIRESFGWRFCMISVIKNDVVK
jgi:hypothetical protein